MTNVWGDTEERNCSLCGDKFTGMGNNPEPLRPYDERCCDPCNSTKVIPARLGMGTPPSARKGWGPKASG